MVDSELFRTTSTFFKDIPWRTDLLVEPGALHKLDSVPDVSVSGLIFGASSVVAQLECSAQAYLSVIREQEQLYHSESAYFPGMAKMRLLHTFCLTGAVPPNEVDTLVKELVKYRLLDVVAFFCGTASESRKKERGIVPFVDKMVSLLSA
jgi:hypothetical protein